MKQIFWKTKTFSKKRGYRFSLRLKTHHFHTKLTYQKPMLRQIEWWEQSGPITKNGVLPVTTLTFWKCYFSLKTSYKELISCTNDQYAHICTFCKRFSFISWCFFPVIILKDKTPSTSKKKKKMIQENEKCIIKKK